ncbi:type VI secretion system Vgr family protein [Enterobacillus tribolii]|uniref:Type VI secretion system secreted protein VgrG n=1 Tax=Enterobacillus tribolii TaxID=1487935 RepID=A0A370R2V9_9GAMM|nr:type VI secretion system tip protein TssI/VgrG [Enterobacillus tribolii]MBW7984755.1 type VI secretion system tip protein VgrG [Enterobacillus tribolii]RDK96756.1 type VI secretion system secreted protein VgrG [Enterobacillus tribolii]
MDRMVVAHTPLADKLLFRSMQGKEELSTLFHYTVELVSKDGQIDLKSLLGKPLGLQIKQYNLPDHWLNGDIMSLALKGKEPESSRYYIYQAEVWPRLWYLSKTRDFRIFQDKTAADIILQVLGDYNIRFDNQLRNSYRQWGYCVQYNESAFDFISRLMEHEGIYYYFEHSEDGHTLVLADAPEAHNPIALAAVPFRGTAASSLIDDVCVDEWQVYDSVTPNYLSVDDYDFHKPYASLLETKSNPDSYSPERAEQFEWPGRFIDRSHAQSYATVRQQESAAQHEKMKASATSSMMTPGKTLTLFKAPRDADNREYLIVRSHYNLWDNAYASGPDTVRGQRTDFTVVPSDVVWRSPRVTKWPKTQGPQTARVVCPEGETIWTDKYGRVKVKFHWDRYAKGDDTSSCWVRVASSWAGQGFGAVQIPRLNDEVVVDFINGDPDRPIIIGRVYNEANMPPWDLPGNATQMGFYSRSKTGHKDTANALRFEDKMGEEQVWIHAERNMDTDIEKNETLDVGVNRTKTIGQDESSFIKRHRTEEVDGNESVTVHQNRTEEVDGNETITIHSNRAETVDGTEEISIGGTRTESVGSDETVTIGGSRSKTVSGNDTLTVLSNQVETVAIAKAESIGAAKALTIGAAYQISVAGAMNTSVGLAQAEEIGLSKTVLVGNSYKQSVAKDKSTTVAKNFNTKTGVNYSVDADGNIKIMAGKTIELICGKSHIKLDKNGNISINGKKFNMKTDGEQGFKAGGNIVLKGKKVLEN